VRQGALIRRYALVAAVAGLVVAADRATKAWAESSLAGDPIEVVPGLLWFTFVENPGSAFSLFQGGGPLLGVAAIVAIVVVLGALRAERPALEVVAFSLILVGAVGNLVDRIIRGDGVLDGKVVDWIQVPNFPVFNLADSALTVGVGLLLVSAWRHRHEH
jgi:signal peptidase II